MGALLALLIPMVPGLIQDVEILFGKVKPKTGETKMSVVMQQLRAALEALKALNVPLPDGTLPATIPVTDDALRLFAESWFQQLKANGQLTRPQQSGTLYLLQGSVTPLVVGLPGATS